MQLKSFAAAGTLAIAAFGAATVSTPALALPAPQTNGAHGILSGNQVIAPITIPISICGNAIAVLGIAGAGCKGGASVHH